MARKSWERMTGKEKLDALKAGQAALRRDVAESIRKLELMEARLGELGSALARDVSRLSLAISEVNVRLSAVAANVLEVSAVAASASEAASRNESKLLPPADPQGGSNA